MTKMRKTILAVLAAVLAAAAIFWRIQTPLVLHLGVFAGSAWDVPSPQSYEIIDAAIARFEEQNPGIKVEYESGILKEEYSEWISQKILEGDAPDVFMILPEDFNTFASIHALKDLDPYIETSLHPDVFYESAWQAGIYDGKQLALPFEANPQMLFINTTLMEEAGLSVPEEGYDLDSFYEACKVLSADTDADGLIDRFGTESYSWKEAANAYGLDLFSADGTKCDLNSDAFKAALGYVQKLDELSAGPSTGEASFDSGNTGFSSMTFAQYRTYAPYPWKIKRFSSFDWQAALMPQQVEAGRIEMPVLQISVYALTPLPDASWKLLQTLCADEQIQSLIYEYAQGVSALKAAGDQNVEEEEDLQLLRQVMQTPASRPHFEKYNTAISMIDASLSSLLRTENDLDLALIDLEKTVSLYLNE